MTNTYLPVELKSNNCVVVQSEDIIRVYDEIPENNKTVSYTDYYINSHYIFRQGTMTYNNYSSLPVCLDNAFFTTKEHYRNDYVGSLIIFLIFAFCGLYLPFKLFMKMFRKVR